MDTPPEFNCARLVYRNSGNRPLLELLPLTPPGVALDCGCGAGDNARALREARWGVTGITISPDEAACAREYCEAVHIANLERGVPGEVRGPFDLILFSHVLEHLQDPLPVLSDAQKLLAPSGCIAVALPNVLNWRQRLDFVRGRFEYTDGGVMDRTHVRFYTFVSGRQMLEASGLRVVRATVEGSFPSRYLRRILPTWSGWLDRLAGRHLPGLFGSQALYVCIAGAGPAQGAG